ncbi:Rv3235 family protein [Cellulomonas sp. NPDC058312]|uniref:Rv3235 family protein n=1 Tax=Cellulomonas sp. NPDC058312 TaxID=3346441 RepID=UPI0036E15922
MSTAVDVRVVPAPKVPAPVLPEPVLAGAVLPGAVLPAEPARPAAVAPVRAPSPEGDPRRVAPGSASPPGPRVRPRPARRARPTALAVDAGVGACAPEVVRLGTARLAAYSHAAPEMGDVRAPVPLPALPPGTAPGGAGTLDVRQACCMVAIAAVEVLAGTRPLAQLARWVTPEVYDSLSRRAALAAPRDPASVPLARPGTSDGDGAVAARSGPRRPSVRRLRTCPVDEHAVEASVVVAHLDRVRAVAVRLTRASGRWRAAALVVG